MELIGYTVDGDMILSLTMTDYETLRQLLGKHKLKNNGIHQALTEDFDRIDSQLEIDDETE